MKSIEIKVNPSYEVTVGSGAIDNIASILQKLHISGKVAVVCDSNVEKLYLDRVLSCLKMASFDTCHFTFPAGEGSKNLDTLSDILEFFAESQLTRRDTAIALGGGVTGDMVGFASGVYMRGISYVQVPTTLLASVDSSVGGKTAVDLEHGKNLAGVFIQPKAVICDTDTLKTLDNDIYADGMAEAIKTAILGDGELFEMLEKHSPREIDEDIIVKCVEYKGRVVSEDEFEAGKRKLLNLGHTPAHSIEKLSGYTIPHGHAVAMGIAIMARASEKLGYIDSSLLSRIIGLLEKYSLPTKSPFSAKELSDTALYDKKRTGEYIDIINIRGIGNCTIDKTHISDLEKIFEKGEV